MPKNPFTGMRGKDFITLTPDPEGGDEQPPLEIQAVTIGVALQMLALDLEESLTTRGKKLMRGSGMVRQRNDDVHREMHAHADIIALLSSMAITLGPVFETLVFPEDEDEVRRGAVQLAGAVAYGVLSVEYSWPSVGVRIVPEFVVNDQGRTIAFRIAALLQWALLAMAGASFDEEAPIKDVGTAIRVAENLVEQLRLIQGNNPTTTGEIDSQ